MYAGFIYIAYRNFTNVMVAQHRLELCPHGSFLVSVPFLTIGVSIFCLNYELAIHTKYFIAGWIAVLFKPPIDSIMIFTPTAYLPSMFCSIVFWVVNGQGTNIIETAPFTC